MRNQVQVATISLEKVRNPHYALLEYANRKKLVIVPNSVISPLLYSFKINKLLKEENNSKKIGILPGTFVVKSGESEKVGKTVAFRSKNRDYENRFDVPKEFRNESMLLVSHDLIDGQPTLVAEKSKIKKNVTYFLADEASIVPTKKSSDRLVYVQEQQYGFGESVILKSDIDPLVLSIGGKGPFVGFPGRTNNPGHVKYSNYVDICGFDLVIFNDVFLTLRGLLISKEDLPTLVKIAQQAHKFLSESIFVGANGIGFYTGGYRVPQRVNMASQIAEAEKRVFIPTGDWSMPDFLRESMERHFGKVK